jgi:hypothetical protein
MTRADWLVLAFLIALQPWLYRHYWRDQGAADSAVITALGQAPRHVSLQHDQTLRVHGPLGDSVLEVRAGRVRFLSSPCRGKQCIHSGWLSRAGDFAACLPNRVSVTLTGTAMQYDAINY